MSPLAPGLIIAAPPLGDPNFERAVVLLASHGPDGAFGWVINGPAIMTLGELIERADVKTPGPDLEGVVRVGGPVSREQVWLLYKSEHRFQLIDGQFQVGDGIIATASRGVLEQIAQGTPAASVVGMAGYAGWAPEQLEEEIGRGAWLPLDIDVGLVFDEPRAHVWEKAYALRGTSPMAFTTRTIGSA